MTDEELRKMLDEATPGPWAVDATDPADVVVWGADSELIGNIGHRVQRVDVIFDCDERNARLIAAAPDLAAEVLTLRAQLNATLADRALILRAVQAKGAV